MPPTASSIPGSNIPKWDEVGYPGSSHLIPLRKNRRNTLPLNDLHAKVYISSHFIPGGVFFRPQVYWSARMRKHGLPIDPGGSSMRKAAQSIAAISVM